MSRAKRRYLSSYKLYYYECKNALLFQLVAIDNEDTLEIRSECRCHLPTMFAIVALVSNHFILVSAAIVVYWLYLYWYRVCRLTTKINLLWPSDAIWRHKSRGGVSTFSQTITSFLLLTARERYLNQSWFIKGVLWHSSEDISTSNSHELNT